VTIWTGVANVVAMTLGVVSGSITGAIWGYTIASLVSCCLGARAVAVSGRSRGVVADYRNCLGEWPMLWRFSLPSMLANMLVMPVTWICNAMLVNQPGGFGEMATYNIVTQWRQIMLFLPGVAAQVFLPIMTSKTGSGGTDSMKANYLRINLIITLPILVVMSLLSPLIMTLYGHDYMAQWPVFVVVQLATLAQIIQSPVITSWTAEGKMWTNLVANVFWGGSLVLFSRLFIRQGAFGLGLALLISFLLYFVVIFFIRKTEEPLHAPEY
jgi:O-antigen/teichoic acid export membrane protein